MTDPNSPPRIRDIAPEQATLLHQIHHLAARVARLRQAVSVTTPGSAASTGLLDEIGEVERARELTEIGARANGMPASWVNQARAAGQSGRAWTEELLLPAAPSPTGRRNTKRVVEDTRQLADMAAVTVVRRRRLATDGITTDPEPAAAEQFRRNMAALWTRVSATATSVGMGRHRRGRVFNAASVEIDRRVETYRHYSLDDLNAAWRTYTTPTIAASVRRALKRLRSAERGTDPPAADPETEQPPTPKALIERAHHTLDAIDANGSDAGIDIDTAINAAIPDTAHDGDPCAEVHSGEPAALEAHQDAGPDP